MSYYYYQTPMEKFLNILPALALLTVLAIVLISLFVSILTYEEKPLAERVVAVQTSTCGHDTVIDENTTTATCLVQVTVSSQYEVDALNDTDFQHVKLLIDGEQYAPEPEVVEEEIEQ